LFVSTSKGQGPSLISYKLSLTYLLTRLG